MLTPRIPLAITIALLLAAPFAWAEDGAVIHDAADDETATPFLALTNPFVPRVADCRAPAVDVRQATIVSSGETLHLTLEMTDLSTLRARCGGVIVMGHVATYRLSLFAPWENETDAARSSIEAIARTTGTGFEGCIRLTTENPDDWVPDCYGSFARDGNTLLWSLPLTGELLAYVSTDGLGVIEETETRAYDLRGLEVEASAGATLMMGAGVGPAAALVRDGTSPIVVTL